MTSILIAGYYGLGNIGDEAILSGMITSLRKNIEDPTISVFTNNPGETRVIHSVSPIEQTFKHGLTTYAKNVFLHNEIGRIKREIDNCDVFILGGGSLLQDLRVYYLPILLSLIKLAQRKKKKTVVYGIGAGPINTLLGQKICRSVLNDTDLVTVRDSMSKDVLEKCGIQNVIRTADPAFGIDVPPQETINRYLKSMNMINGERYIASTAYNWLHDSDIYRNATTETNDLYRRRESLAQLFEHIVKESDQRLLFVPTVKTDREGYTVIKDLMPSSEKANVLNYNAHFDAIIATLSRTDVLIGMRLHSLILATIMGIPVVPISYCGKVKSYLELIGLENMHLDVENLGTKEFAGQFSENFNLVCKNRNSYAVKQQKTAEQLRQKALLNAKLVAELIA